MKSRLFLLLIFLLVLKGVLLSLCLGFYEIGLSPDEAQYWTWSQQLDWGYYSKPPGIAWQIWATTSIFGESEFGVRFGALLIGFCLALVVYFVARFSGLQPKSSFWAAIVAAFSPLGIYLSIAATTDGGAILFLMLAIATVVKGIREEKGPHYPLAGVWILFGGLFKWIVFVFWPFVFLFLFFFHNLRKWTLFWGILISLLAFVPSIYWNMNHEWATFKHVGTAIGERTGGNFFPFLTAQFGLLSPVFFVLLIVSYFFLYRESNRALYFCAAFPFAILIYLAAAFFKNIQPNWAAFLYPPGFVLVAWVGYERLKRGRMWLHFGTWLSIFMMFVAFSIPWVQKTGFLPLTYKLNPFRQAVGWEKLTPALQKVGYNPNNDFLFGDKYQTASLLSFYSPGQKQAYFFNISETRKNQFTYWPQMQEHEVGKTGYFVVLENTKTASLPWYEQHYLKRLSPYFEKVEYVGDYPLFSVAGVGVKYALIFKCVDYLGRAPQDPEQY